MTIAEMEEKLRKERKLHLRISGPRQQADEIIELIVHKLTMKIGKRVVLVTESTSDFTRCHFSI